MLGSESLGTCRGRRSSSSGSGTENKGRGGRAPTLEINSSQRKATLPLLRNGNGDGFNNSFSFYFFVYSLCFHRYLALDFNSSPHPLECKVGYPPPNVYLPIFSTVITENKIKRSFVPISVQGG